MDRHELNQMFDRLTPDPQRERELLKKLLQDDTRRIRPMKSWKQVVAAAVAAALLVTAATAAVPGLSAPLWRVLGIAPEDTQSMELLASGTMEVDVTTESNGATFHVTQVLRDRLCIVVVGEFATAEGTVLDTGDFGKSCEKPRAFRESGLPVFLDANDEPVEFELKGPTSAFWWSMPDEDPLDNRCSVYYVYTAYSEDEIDNAVAMRVTAKNFGYNVGGKDDDDAYTVIPGDWSFEVPLPQQDQGYFWKTNKLITNLDGAEITLRKVYLSPMEIELTFFREGGEPFLSDAEDDVERDVAIRWNSFCQLQAVLTTKDGESVTLYWGGGGGGVTGGGTVTRLVIADFIAQDRKGDYIDPADFQGGTLTLEWKTEDGKTDSASFSLDDLQPVSP